MELKKGSSVLLRLYTAIALFAILLTSACGTDTIGPAMSPTDFTQVPGDSPSRVDLLRAGVLRHADSRRMASRLTATAEIGPEGGIVVLGDFEIIVPEGAVDAATRFSIDRRGALKSFAAVELGPHDQAFNVPVRVRMPSGVSDGVDQIQVGRWQSGSISPVATQVLDDGRLEFEANHFSFFVSYCVLDPGDGSGGEYCRYPVEDLEPSGDGIYLGWSYTQCVDSSALWFEDVDSDGMDDFCEEDLADAFAPMLQFGTDCNWDSGLNRMGGEYYWAATKNTQRTPYEVYIAYLPAYYWDCGEGAGSEATVAEIFNANGHSGDSEYILLNVKFEPDNHWYTHEAALSAHGPAPWYHASLLQWSTYSAPGGAPVVWVSTFKHANYPSYQSCVDAGWFNWEECNTSGPIRQFPATIPGNVGSSWDPLIDCTYGRSISSLRDAGEQECIWSAPSFRGWQDVSVGPAPPAYGDLLDNYGF